MKIRLLCMGKTNSKELLALIEPLEKRLPKYISFDRVELTDVKNAKNLSEEELKLKEFKTFEKNISPTETLILLDENGTEKTSVEFAQFLQHKMNIATQKLTFVIGGAYGFCADIKKYNPQKLSLSKMTFTHQMIRLLFIEQLYRAYTILEGKPYHHS